MQVPADFIGKIEGSVRLLAIARNPMLLSLMSLVHYRSADLPFERAALYEKCIELLVDTWNVQRGVAPITAISQFHKSGILRAIAAAFQTRACDEASRVDVEKIITEAAERFSLSISSKEVLREIEEQTGLLTQRSIDMFSFSHLTLQEYLVAKHVKETNNTDILHENFDNQAWREVTLLYAGLIDDASSLIRDILSVDSLARWMLAAYTRGEARRCDPKLTEVILEHLEHVLNGLEGGETDRETLVSVLAATCADYQGVASRPQEKFSETLIGFLAEAECASTVRRARASIAMRSLALARVATALPILVALLANHDLDTALETDVIDSIVLFGNIALPHLEKVISDGEKSYPIWKTFFKRLIQVLCAIDTPEAAKLLIKCYSLRLHDTLISSALLLF